MMNKQQRGFTLIEVLIALAIVAIALTAIVKASSSDIEDTIHLRDITIAHWVGGNAIHSLQLGLVPQTTGTTIRRQTQMLNHQWSWTASIHKTPNPLINEITVEVFSRNGKQKITTMQGFMRVATNEK